MSARHGRRGALQRAKRARKKRWRPSPPVRVTMKAAAEQKRARKERRNRQQEKKAVEQAKAEATIRPQATKRLLVLGIISTSDSARA